MKVLAKLGVFIFSAVIVLGTIFSILRLKKTGDMSIAVSLVVYLLVATLFFLLYRQSSILFNIEWRRRLCANADSYVLVEMGTFGVKTIADRQTMFNKVWLGDEVCTLDPQPGDLWVVFKPRTDGDVVTFAALDKMRITFEIINRDPGSGFALAVHHYNSM